MRPRGRTFSLELHPALIVDDDPVGPKQDFAREEGRDSGSHTSVGGQEQRKHGSKPARPAGPGSMAGRKRQRAPSGATGASSGARSAPPRKRKAQQSSRTCVDCGDDISSLGKDILLLGFDVQPEDYEDESLLINQVHPQSVLLHSKFGFTGFSIFSYIP